jgi:WD40 repeat protein
LSPNAPTLKLWQVETGKDVLTYAGHAGGTAGISITKDGLHALSVGRQDSNVKYWDIAKPQELRTFRLISAYNGIAYLRGIAFSPDETKFAVAGMSLLRLYDLRTGAQIWDFKELVEHEEIRNITFSPDGSLLLATGLQTHWIDAASGQRIRSYRHPNPNGSSAFHYAVAISPKGDIALYNDDRLRRIDLATGTETMLEFRNPNGIRSIAISPDGALALAGGEWTDLALLDVKSGKTAFAFSTPGGSPDTGAVAISPNGQIAVVGGTRQGTLTFYDLKGINAAST